MRPDAVDHISIRGFKSIASLNELALRPINILIGANGSGKSNFLGAFAFLKQISEGRLQNTVAAAGGAEKLLHFGSKTTPEMSFRLSFGGQSNYYAINLAHAASDRLFPSEEAYSRLGHDARLMGPAMASEHGRGEAGISAPAYSVDGIRIRLETWRVYHLNDTSSSSPLRKTARVDDNRHLHRDGSNLAPFLYYLRQKFPDTYALIRRTVQMVAPFFDDFRLEPLRLNEDTIKLEWRHQTSDQYFDVSSLSDGTLRFMVLATLFLQPEEYRPIILVDEPELGLHPSAIGMLAALIRQASERSQIIVSTQSSLLLDHSSLRMSSWPTASPVLRKSQDSTTISWRPG